MATKAKSLGSPVATEAEGGTKTAKENGTETFFTDFTEPTAASTYEYSGMATRGPVPLGTWAISTDIDANTNSNADTDAILLEEDEISPRVGAVGDLCHQKDIDEDTSLSEAEWVLDSSSTPTTDWESVGWESQSVGSPISTTSPRCLSLSSRASSMSSSRSEISEDSFASAEDGKELLDLHHESMMVKNP